jgi:hypothetical protein
LSWWRRVLGWGDGSSGGASKDVRPDPAPRLDPWTARIAALEVEAVSRFIADLQHEPAVVRRDILRQVRLRLGDHLPVILALARAQPADAEAIWTTLLVHPAHAAEACDALADLATQVGVRQTWLERAAAAAPGDIARLRRCLAAAPGAPSPAMPQGLWRPLAERLPAQFVARAPIAHGPSGSVIRVVAVGPWAAKGLRTDLHAHAGLARLFDEMRHVQALDLKGVVSLTYVGAEQGCWVRTLGVATLADRPELDLTAVAQAVQTLHAAGLTHGNICPQNVIVDADGQARLTDVGVARLRGVLPSVEADLAALTRLMEAR